MTQRIPFVTAAHYLLSSSASDSRYSKPLSFKLGRLLYKSRPNIPRTSFLRCFSSRASLAITFSKTSIASALATTTTPSSSAAIASPSKKRCQDIEFWIFQQLTHQAEHAYFFKSAHGDSWFLRSPTNLIYTLIEFKIYVLTPYFCWFVFTEVSTCQTPHGIAEQHDYS